MDKLTKGKIKLIRALEHKKYRKKYKLFIAEGFKIVSDLLNSNFIVHEIIGIKQLIDKLNLGKSNDIEITIVNENDFEKISFQKTPQNILAIVEQKQWKFNPEIATSPIIALDFIQDPGNLGTIIRLADWFGIPAIICSTDTVDVYNPKVVQASMGSIFRVPVIYTDLENFLNEMRKLNKLIYGTFLDGENIYTTDLEQNSIIIFGNEASGIRDNLNHLIFKKLNIPKFSQNSPINSLNVAISAAVVISEFKRRSL